ncbi:DMT family transporter [Chitinasiproducens palmae]|nr:DMT family transporter [Chitinasiproducens palmae]
MTTDRPSTRSAGSAWWNGLLGIAIFSASLPATRIAVASLDPFFLSAARAAIAGVLALLLLRVNRTPLPQRADVPGLAVTALGCVLGFPLCTALALRYVDSAHAIVFTGLLPVMTAIFGVLRAHDRPRPLFWIGSLAGAAVIAAYILRAGATLSPQGDGLMLLAIVVCGLGYAEGGRLSRRLGGWQVICWALVLSLPFAVVLAVWLWPAHLASVTWSGWAALGYVSLFSMLIGFVFWYRALALGGVASIGQLQLLQPFMGLALAALLLGERIEPALLGATLLVVACVALARRYAAPARPSTAVRRVPDRAAVGVQSGHD